MDKYIKLIKEYSQNTYKLMMREAKGNLKHPFIVPGSKSYSNCLWDWDSWLTDIAVRQIVKDKGGDIADFEIYEKGCVINFFESIWPSGRMPIRILDSGNPEKDGETDNIHKPCLAQHAAFIVKNSDEGAEWLRPYMERLERFICYYMTDCRHEETSLYFWLNDGGIGVDNDPCTFYRPDKSSASVYLNCLMYKELKAFVYLCRQLDISCEKYENEAENLKNSIREHLWDDKDGMYYSADINLKPIDTNSGLHCGKPRHWHCLIQRIGVWSGFMTMWAGIATKEQAERMVRENLLDKNGFWAGYGVRTLSKYEKMYCIVKSGNPSCWLGPIWGVSNYLTFKGLVDYGFNNVAKELAEKTIKLLGRDIEECGEMHEYYHPDTGDGVNNPGFQNWNLLVNNMIAWLQGKEQITEF